MLSAALSHGGRAVGRQLPASSALLPTLAPLVFGKPQKYVRTFFSTREEVWPERGVNTILNIVPQGNAHIVERFGKLRSVEYSGFYFALPLVDKIAYVIDMRERAMAIRPQQAISRDNVSLTLDGVVYVRVVEPEKCAYGARRPFYAVAQHAQSVMRAAIGRRNMEDAFHDRAGLNKDIRDDISAAAVAWGLEVMRYEVLNIEADASVSRAMDLQATAERRRREEIITADGLASAMERQAEAEKRSAILKAEGMADSVRLAAQAERERQVLTAMGQAESLKAVGAGLSQEAGVAAAHMQLAQAYMDMMGRMGSTSNTLMLSGGAGGAGSVEEMAARVSAVFSTMGVVPPVKTDPSVQTSDLPEAVSKSETTKPGKRAAPTPSNSVMATVEAALSSSPDADKREAKDESFGAGLLDNKYFSNMR